MIIPSDVKTACASGAFSIGSFVVSVSTAVEVLQGLAALVAIGSGLYSFYLALRHKRHGKKKKSKR